METLFKYFVIVMVLSLSGAPRAYCVEISVKDNSPELIERAENWIKKATPKRMGFKVGGFEVFVNRDISIDDVTYDPETAVMRIKGTISYKTGPLAFQSASGSADLDIKYNFASSDLEGLKFTLDTGPVKIPIDLTPIKKAMEGDVAKLLELIPNGGLVKRKSWSEYDSRKRFFQEKYGTDNVYFASSDFVRWCSPATAGKWVGLLVASGGSAAPAIEAEVKTQMRKESSHILFWLKKKAGNTAQAAVDSLLAGNPIQLPKLKLVWQAVEYRSQVSIAGNQLPPMPSVNHAAFVLIWEDSNGPRAEFDSQPRAESDDSKLRPKWSIGARYALGPTGCRIIFLKPNGAAKNAGLKVDDVITKFMGTSVGSSDFETDRLLPVLKSATNQAVKIEYLRNGITDSKAIILDLVL